MKTILKKVKAEFIKDQGFISGLCNASKILSLDDQKKFKDYLVKHRPKKMYWQWDFVQDIWKQSKETRGVFYWKPSTKKARIKWLDKHIKLNS